MNPHLYRKLPYDGIRSFTPITVLVRFPWVIAVHPSVPASTFQELVKVAKARPRVSCRTARSGSAPRRTSAWTTSSA
jgi:tripartite-type tricarboxylate transporter receptor subunit TctC